MCSICYLAGTRKHGQNLDEDSGWHAAMPNAVKRFGIVKPDFTVENGLLSPTQKIRRREISAQYHQEIERLY